MDIKQKINCNVESCVYNDCEECKCTLDEITVEPCQDCSTGNTDESMCGSYECCDYDDDEEDEEE